MEIDDPLRDGRLQALVTEELARGGAQARDPRAAATLVGGVLRAGPSDLDLGAARWAGTIGYDLRVGRLDARGTLAGGPVPRGWNAGPPAMQFGLTGPLAAPEQVLDVGALSNGLATLSCSSASWRRSAGPGGRQVERQRRRARIEMDRVRAAALKAAADKAAAEKAAAEEAARRARAQARGRPSRPRPPRRGPNKPPGSNPRGMVEVRRSVPPAFDPSLLAGRPFKRLPTRTASGARSDGAAWFRRLRLAPLPLDAASSPASRNPLTGAPSSAQFPLSTSVIAKMTRHPRCYCDCLFFMVPRLEIFWSEGTFRQMYLSVSLKYFLHMR